MTPSIEINNLVVRYGTFTAVDHLNLEIQSGELFGFLGPNGAGKTSTIKVLTGNQHPTGGHIKVAGFSIPTQFEAAKPAFGYVPDTENHIDEFSGRENLRLFARLYDIPDTRIDELLARLELSDAANIAAGNYSKGMRRKLLIAREILHQPSVLYLDEPTANLDAHSTKLVRDLLRDLASGGTTIFLTTHNMEEVEQICDRVAIMCQGKLVDCDTPTSFVTRHAERFVDTQYERNGNVVRASFNLDIEEQRSELANVVSSEACVTVHSREFNFHDVFLKITGQAYS